MKTKIIFDLEATCEDRAINPDFDNEVIEIGAVKVVDDQVVDEFQTFVKPSSPAPLTAYCKDLTNIAQADVDQAVSFEEAVKAFQEWAGGEVEYLSWGFYDRKQLEKDSARYELPVDWLKTHRSLKHEHQELKKLKRSVGVKKALKMEGLAFEGTHHRGIDDARNIARIYQAGFVNNGLKKK